MFSRLICALIASAAVVLPATALAQATSTRSGPAYPTKPIRLIVPFSPGGTNDIPAEIAKWTKVAIDTRMPRAVD